MKNTTTEIAKLLNEVQSFALFCHVRPDGDAIGAVMALKLALAKLGKTADIYCEDSIDDKIAEFVDASNINNSMLNKKYDMAVAVDCGDEFRLGIFTDWFIKQRNTMAIDHHGGKPYAKYNCILNYASSCEIIFEILDLIGVELDKEIATMLYIGITTDTGNFAHPSTSVRTFEMAGKLLAYGVYIPDICRVFFRSKSLALTKLLGRALSRVRSYYNDKLIILYVTKQDLADFGLSQNTTKNMVDNAINVASALVGVSLTEENNNVYNISMRGKDFEIRSICERFGGGGHLFASGCQAHGFFEDVIDKIVRYVGDRFEQDHIEI